MFRLPGECVPYGNYSLAVAVTSIVFVAVAIISVFGLFGAIFAPVPVLYYYSKMGRVRGVIIFVLSMTLALIVLKPLNIQRGILYFSMLGFVGIALSELLRKNFSIEKTIIYCSGALLSFGLAVIIYVSLTSGETPWSVIFNHISEVVKDSIKMYSQSGVSAENAAFLTENTDLIIRIVSGLLPSIVIVGMIFLIWVNILEGRLLFKRMGMWYPSFGNLCLWRTLDKTIWLVVAAGVLIIIPMETARIVGMNALIVTLFIYMLQGLAIMSFFFQEKNVPLFLRAFGYFLVFAQQFLLLIVAGVGMIDTWVDFRKIDRKPDISVE